MGEDADLEKLLYSGIIQYLLIWFIKVCATSEVKCVSMVNISLIHLHVTYWRVLHTIFLNLNFNTKICICPHSHC